ncbi:MAG: hypothetical protein AAF558_00340 [Verrucomicrobiota bacterium]
MIFIVPVAAACLYAVGSMGLKKSMQAGTSARRVMAVSNIAMALWSVPLFFFFSGTWDLKAWLAAVAAGIALFAGRICSIKALEAGDLSIVAPLLGMKTILVALLSLAFKAEGINLWLLVAAALASAGVALLQRGPTESMIGMKKAALFAFAASLLFACTDVLVQSSARVLGVGYFHPTLFLTVAVLIPLLGKHPAPPQEGKKPLWFGSGIMGFQTSVMILVIGLSGQATLVNIVYSSRALWSVVVDRLVGEPHIKDFMVSRLAGALCITGAVILAILTR